VSAGPTALEKFRTIVLTDPALQRELRAAADRASFVQLVVERARKRGCVLDAAAVEAALNAAAREWLLQWMMR
jgi:hypothetical protein